MKTITPMGNICLASGLVLSVLANSLFITEANADPVRRWSRPVSPPPNPVTVLPQLFCFRFTDIKAIEGDPEGDRFAFSFEILNWSDRPVGGVRLVLNKGGFEIPRSNPIAFAAAAVDFNGRPIGLDADPMPGNKQFNNFGTDLPMDSETAVQYTAIQGFFGQTGLPSTRLIPSIDILSAPSRNGADEICNLLNPDTPCTIGPIQGSGTSLRQGVILGGGLESVDDGDNVLDGFTFIVDGFNEGEALSINWYHMDQDGVAIGGPDSGNPFGFGTVNIVRVPVDETTGDPNDSEFSASLKLFEGNTGASIGGRTFAPSNGNGEGFVNNVTQTIPISTFIGFDDIVNTDQPKALFAAEIGVGTTAEPQNPNDTTLPQSIEPLPLDDDGEPLAATPSIDTSGNPVELPDDTTIVPVESSPLFDDCDLDRNGQIDRSDIALIMRSRSVDVPPGTSGDVQADGNIGAGDARSCVLKCNKPACAP